MLPELLQKTNLYKLLFLIDNDFSETLKAQPCPFCNGTLHQGNYMRKPRGCSINLPDDYLIRHSLCCEETDCRKRSLPPSCRFLGRKVYFWPVILIVMALRQGRKNSYSAGRLIRLFNIARNTLKRWFSFFAECFPILPGWHKLRGYVPADISNQEIPGRLLYAYIEQNGGKAFEGLIRCLFFLESADKFSLKIDGDFFHAEDV